MNFAIGDAAPDRLAEFADDVGLALVEDRVDRIEAKPVEVELVEPIESIVYEKITHRPAAGSTKIDRRAPWRLMSVGEEIRRDRRQIIPLGAEVVVDDVEKHSEPARMARL